MDGQGQHGQPLKRPLVQYYTVHVDENRLTHAVSHGGKLWRYLLIPHDTITENRTLVGLVNQFRVN
jgi:hypothetical protein